MLCKSCKVAKATNRVVSGKGGRRWAKPSGSPNLCRACAVRAAAAINKINNVASSLGWL